MDKELREIIEALEKTCTLWDRIQEKKAVLEAESIIRKNLNFEE